MTVLRLIPSNLSHYHPLVKCLKKYRTIDSWIEVVSSYARPNTVSQGWKLHISATIPSMVKVASAMIPYLKMHNISSKIAGSPSFLYELSQSETQRGKFITIYPDKDDDCGPNQQKNDNNTMQLAIEIDQFLQDKITDGTLSLNDFDVIPFDARLGDTGVLFVRYGAFSAFDDYLTVRDQHGNELLHPNDPRQTWYEPDNRSGRKPNFVTWNPFGLMLTEPILFPTP
jgi:hypothetical protein